MVPRTKPNDVESRETQRDFQNRFELIPGGRPPAERNPAGSKKPGKKSTQDERREKRENEATKHRWRSFRFQVRGDRGLSIDLTDSRAGIRAAGNSTPGGAGETSSTVGIVGATGAGVDGGSEAGNTMGLGGGGGSAAGSPGSAPQVLGFCWVVVMGL